MSHATVQSHQDITHRFDYHAPTPERVTAHEEIRSACKELAHILDSRLPSNCREKSLAITSLEQAMFWANAAIAREKD